MLQQKAEFLEAHLVHNRPHARARDVKDVHLEPSMEEKISNLESLEVDNQ